MLFAHTTSHVIWLQGFHASPVTTFNGLNNSTTSISGYKTHFLYAFNFSGSIASPSFLLFSLCVLLIDTPSVLNHDFLIILYKLRSVIDVVWKREIISHYTNYLSLMV